MHSMAHNVSLCSCSHPHVVHLPWCGCCCAPGTACTARHSCVAPKLRGEVCCRAESTFHLGTQMARYAPVLWCHLVLLAPSALQGYEGMRKDVEKCLRNAHLLKVGGPGPLVPGVGGSETLWEQGPALPSCRVPPCPSLTSAPMNVLLLPPPPPFPP